MYRRTSFSHDLSSNFAQINQSKTSMFFENIVSGIHFNNKEDNQKHGGKRIEITKDVKLVKTDSSV